MNIELFLHSESIMHRKFIDSFLNKYEFRTLYGPIGKSDLERLSEYYDVDFPMDRAVYLINGPEELLNVICSETTGTRYSLIIPGD